MSEEAQRRAQRASAVLGALAQSPGYSCTEHNQLPLTWLFTLRVNCAPQHAQETLPKLFVHPSCHWNGPPRCLRGGRAGGLCQEGAEMRKGSQHAFLEMRKGRKRSQPLPQFTTHKHSTHLSFLHTHLC